MKVNREVERSADAMDQASSVTELFLEGALAEQRAAAAPETHPDFDGTHCVECGDDIPSERLALKRVRCCPCQEQLEKARKQYGK
jgi:RNA polymerase-binding transcription factor DksA